MGIGISSPAADVPGQVFISGRWYTPGVRGSGIGTSFTSVADTIYAVLVRVERESTWSKFGVPLGATNGSASVQCAVFAMDTTTGLPAERIAVSDITAADTLALELTPTGGNFTLTPNYYWLALKPTTTGTAPTFYKLESLGLFPVGCSTTANHAEWTTSASQPAGLRVPYATAGIPTSWPAGTITYLSQTSGVPKILLKNA